MLIRELLEEYELDKNNNVPIDVLSIDLFEPYFTKGTENNRVYTLTGKTQRKVKYNKQENELNFEYELVINLNKIKKDSMSIFEKEDNDKVSEKELQEALNLLNTPIVTYTIYGDNFTHREEYNCYGGLIQHT